MSIFVLGRDPVSVKNVTKPLFSAHILLNISESIMGRDHINVQNVAKPLVIVVGSLNI